MRNFISSLLGSLTALVIFSAGLLLCGIVFIIVLIASGAERHRGPEDGSYLVFKLDANIPDAPPLPGFLGITDEQHNLQLRPLLRAIDAAAKDDAIAGMLITGSLQSEGFGGSLAALKEVHEALVRFRKTGKPLLAYMSDADTRDYYLASTASQLTLDPFGMILLPGLASRPMFLAGTFEKYGIGVQVTRVGKYKSAVEPYTRKDLSPENREQLGQLLGDLWTGIKADICASRGLSPEALQGLVDKDGLFVAKAAVERGLVDRLAYRDVVIDELKKKTGQTGPKEPFLQISMQDYIAHITPDHNPFHLASPCVAVVYAEGEIVDGEGEPDQVGGNRFARELRRLRQDNSVKAIVLRVNSPGGSASASETIQREVRLAREKKPVIVSMGGYAASGGYWISAYGNRIFAEPSTITGSIGVFGLFFDVEKLAGSVGLSFDTVKTGRFADALTITRPKTPEEMEIMQRMVDWIYEEFIAKVSEGRKIPRERVEEIAQGRVWSGQSALKLGLVDEIGGLEQAIAYAARKAKLGKDPRVLEYPRKHGFSELMEEVLERANPQSARASLLERAITAHAGAPEMERARRELGFLLSCNDPRGVYARLPLDPRPE